MARNLKTVRKKPKSPPEPPWGRVTMKAIEDFGRQIGEQFHAQKVILFGSYARGNPGPDSDVDVLVVGTFKEDPIRKSVEIQMRLRPRFPLDLLVRTPDQIRHRLDIGDCFMKEVVQQGRVLYEGRDA